MLEACAVRLRGSGSNSNEDTISHDGWHLLSSYDVTLHLHSATTWWQWDSNTVLICLQGHAAFLHCASYREEIQSLEMSRMVAQGGSGLWTLNLPFGPKSLCGQVLPITCLLTHESQVL